MSLSRLEKSSEQIPQKPFIPPTPIALTSTRESWALSAIDDILELLKDGRWHNVREAVERSGLHESKVEKILSFLAEYKFIALNKEQQEAKLTPTMLKFLKEIQRTNKKVS